MSESSTSIKLNCYVIGDSPDLCTTLSLPLDTSISDLRIAFSKCYKAQGYGEVKQPIFYKVERSPDDLLPRAEDQKLGGIGRVVRDFWPETDEIDRDLIHILVHVTVPSDTGEATHVMPAEELEDVSELAIGVAKPVRLKFLNELPDSSSSKAARPAAFREQQTTNNYILIGRPAEHTGPPIVLYHPVFGRFLRNLRSLEPLSAITYARAVDYFQTSQALYKDESIRRGGRDESSRRLLGTVLGGLLMKSGDYDTRPDGVATTSNGAWCIIMEMKNEIGSGGSDPTIQAAQSYSRCWKSLPGFVDRCCCPSILIAIAGPWMSVLGAIFLDRPVIQPLTDFLWVGDNPSKPSDVDRIARVFHAISEARLELESYYTHLPGPDQGDASIFPYPTDYIDSAGKQVKFKYKKHVNRTGRASGKKELVFFAQTLEDSPTRIVVKFVTRYHSAAHRLLAREGLAPELLYDGTMHLENQPGPEHSMIVMEYLSGIDLGRSADHPLPSSVSADIKRALSLLHDQELVFADLRRPNVMLVKDATGKVAGAKLVDFDWCGKHLEGRYPLSINKTSIAWAEGVEPGALLNKAHDTEMWKQLGL
ncbi:unnamed protein product [Rhizoctonia solani]|uniref:Protein kinase domain-containing protein n=1 Tax=Rhizoctonia solani TaxID=456999 RepID=A0A8H3H9Z2_9AGAM|nr:unnamed protein product [Rhizoctonia solani]